MSKKDKEGMSKRQEFREKRRRAEQRTRIIWIAVITILAVFVAFVLIYPQLKPVGAIQATTSIARPKVDRNSTGDPNAPVKLVEFSDYQCPYCKNFWQDTEAQIIDAYVTPGKVLFTARSAGNFVSDNVNRATGGTDTDRVTPPKPPTAPRTKANSGQCTTPSSITRWARVTALHFQFGVCRPSPRASAWI